MNFTATHNLPKITKNWFFYAVFALFTALPGLQGQTTTCTYSINMFDSFGDGWNGGFLTVISGGIDSTYTLETGSFEAFTFLVTDGTPIIIEWTPGAFVTEPSFELLNPDGLVIFEGTSIIPAGQVYNEIGICPNCPTPDPSLVIINQITDTSAHVNWLTLNVADYYVVEYGPAGFPQGEGLVIETTDSEANLTGLNPCVDYEFFLASNCGIDSMSAFLGPFTFQTTYTPSTPGDTCTYTFELFDSFGDGWNGSVLTANHNGQSMDFTIDFTAGDMAVFTFDAISNLPLEFVYSPGTFENEVSYNIIDPSGFTIFSDGPFPQTGSVFTTIACPTCPAPINVKMTDVNATNATLGWTTFPGSDGLFRIEYGPMGFTRGTGVVDSAMISQNSLKLNGLMENSWYNVYIYLDCGTETSKPIGPLMFHTLWLNDVGITAITEPDPDKVCNLGSSETITVNITNFGQLPQTLFEFYFAVNGVVASIPVPQDGFFTGVVGNDSTQSISFETTYDFSVPDIYVIEAWTELENDSDRSNDTTRIELFTAFQKPVKEDFEDGMFPDGWTTDGVVFAPFSHNNETWVIGDNVFSGDPTFTTTTTRVGPVEAGDSLTFDYRFVDWFDGMVATNLSDQDKLELQISDDCEETYETVLTIDQSNHVPTTDMTNVLYLLDDYDGEAINIRIVGTWGEGDYWLDLDNINVSGCPLTLGLVADIKASVETEATGSINVSPSFGSAPYTYQWNTGDTTALADSLSVGVYEVTVSDANGCSETKIFQVGILVSADEVSGVEQLSLYPNPTSGIAYLDVTLAEAMDFQVRVFNMNGQVVAETERSMAKDIKEELDLGNQPPGMYILQVTAGGRPHYVKLMVNR